MWRALNNLGPVVLQGLKWHLQQFFCVRPVHRNTETKGALPKHFSARQDLHHSQELDTIWDLPRRKKISHVLSLPWKHGQEKWSNQTRRFISCSCYPSTSGQPRASLHLLIPGPTQGSSRHLKRCLSPRQREKEYGRTLWPLSSFKKSTSTHILLPKHIPQPHYTSKSSNLTCTRGRRGRHSLTIVPFVE